MSDVCKLASIYRRHGATSKDLREQRDNPLLIEAFSGTGTLSKAAVQHMHFKDAITVDITNDYDVAKLAFQGDITNASFRARVAERVLQQHISKGRLVYFHQSPPCQEYSRAKTTGELRDLDGANNNVICGLDLARRCKAALWTIENPYSGSKTLWQQQELLQRWNIPRPARVDYCQYGSIICKPTGIAFSSAAAQRDFAAKQCPGAQQCSACVWDPSKRLHSHAGKFTSMGYTERIAIPQQVCARLLGAARKRCYELSCQLAELMDAQDSADAAASKGEASAERVWACFLERWFTAQEAVIRRGGGGGGGGGDRRCCSSRLLSVLQEYRQGIASIPRAGVPYLRHLVPLLASMSRCAEALCDRQRGWGEQQVVEMVAEMEGHAGGWLQAAVRRARHPL